ncbi:MAG: restriction endonuclease subunit S, partial [Actinobacteria bacterium]|nr:restriction endonuclease subunit S [Actinomycetota bacterium]
LSCTKYNGLVDSIKYFGRRVFSEDISKYKIVPRNHFAYATNHIEEGSIGYQNYYDKALVSPVYTVFKTNADVDDTYLYLLFKTELYKNIFDINTSSSVDRRGSLRWKEFSKIAIPVPPLWEQKKIANILLMWNRAIETVATLINIKTLFKKGLRQKLLSGKIRFKEFCEKWVTAEVGELLDYEQPGKYIVDKVSNYDKDLTPVLTANKSFILGSTSIKDNIYEQLPVIIFDDFTMDTKYVNFPFKVKSSAIKILKTKNKQINLKYIYEAMQIMKSPSNMEHKRYYISEYQYKTIELPHINEQTAIVNILNTVDIEIDKLKFKLVLLKEERKGLTQKLLTGKNRVKI